MYRGSLRLYQDNEKLQVINLVGLDSYLAGLVNKEVRSDWPEEAVKAQVIAARSYALASAADRRKKDSLFDLSSDESDQVYDGFLPEDAQANRLVRQTEGLVIFHREEVLKAYYHSSNGGFSEIPENVWGSASFDNAAYMTRASPVDAADKGNEWQVQISPQMGSLLGVGRIHSIRITKRSHGQRVKSVVVSGTEGSKALSGAQFRNAFGPRWLKSTLFSIDQTGVGWVLRGRGWGHGVGLSQMGARRMATKGRTAQQILDFYYPFANVRWIQTVPTLSQSLLPKAR
jgi:stage II sporulation protein D